MRGFEKPNILFIMADQMRAEALSIVNGSTRTPNLDRLAREGVLFRNAITNSVECVPARLSLAAGLYPHELGVQENVRATLDPHYLTWMKAVERHGYRTSVFGKTHLHPHEGDLRDRIQLMHEYGLQTVDETAGPHLSAIVLSNMTQSWRERGIWERYRADLHDRNAKRFVARPSPLGLQDYYDVYVGSRATQYLQTIPASDQPWFCSVSFGGPHEPWDAPEPYASLYDAADTPPPTSRLAGHEHVRGLLRRAFDSPYYSPPMDATDVRRLRANYAGNVTLIDDQIGRILDVLAARDELQRTLVVFTSDHGEMNGDQGLLFKGNFLDPALRIPLIVRPAGGAGRAVDSRALVELIDVGATIADYAGGSDAFSRGRSLRPLIEGVATNHREYVVCEFLDHMMLVDEHWKIELTPAGTTSLLFDRRADAFEQNNLADDPSHAPALAELTETLRGFRDRTQPPADRACHAG